jgi:hypothetical protein
MGVWISKKDISLFAINLVLWLSGIAYTVLFGLGKLSLELSEVTMPEAESGIYVLMMVARFCMIAALVVVIAYDAGYLWDAISKYYKQKNKGWL